MVESRLGTDGAPERPPGSSRMIGLDVFLIWSGPFLKAALLTGARLGFTVGVLTKQVILGDQSCMADILYLGVTVAFFGLSWLLVRLCERL